MKKLSLADLIALEKYLTDKVNKLGVLAYTAGDMVERAQATALKQICTAELNDRLNKL